MGLSRWPVVLGMNSLGVISIVFMMLVKNLLKISATTFSSVINFSFSINVILGVVGTLSVKSGFTVL